LILFNHIPVAFIDYHTTEEDYPLIFDNLTYAISSRFGGVKFILDSATVQERMEHLTPSRRENLTLLSIACTNMDVVRLLHEYDILVFTHKVLEFAVFMGHHECVTYFLKHAKGDAINIELLFVFAPNARVIDVLQHHKTKAAIYEFILCWQVKRKEALVNQETDVILATLPLLPRDIILSFVLAKNPIATKLFS
jgi:hypothetical protein